MPDSVRELGSRTDTSGATAIGQRRYLVLASPQETAIDGDEAYDGVICLGDLLQFAPPPAGDPAGSLLAQFDPTIETAYEAEATGEIIEAIRSLADRREVRRAAYERYDEYLTGVQTEMYYLAGNQDVPAALAAAADTHDHVTHASALPDTCAIDGVVPSFADFPAGTFPGECARGEFYRRVEESDASVLLVHALPPEFDATEYGFDLALGARDDASVPDPDSNAVVELPPYPDDEHTVRVTMPVDGDRARPRVDPVPATANGNHDDT